MKLCNHKNKIAVIIGAGPAGLTAAYELSQKSKDIKCIIFEAENCVGGISKTVDFKGNKMDIGGHRFFSKSDRVMEWWKNVMPDLLVRHKVSRIYFQKKFFDYPITFRVILNLGPAKIIKIGFSYLKIKLFPIKQEKSLADFFINRFGMELYLTFFKNYTEKLWGVPCEKIDKEWGSQRVKGLSISKALSHFIKQTFFGKNFLREKNVESSLVENFLYPKFGPSQMWQKVADIIAEREVEMYFNHEVVGIESFENKITGIKIKNLATGETKMQSGDYFFSTMPVKQLVENFEPAAPAKILDVAKGIMYRDYVMVGLLVKKIEIRDKSDGTLIPDNWIYIQDPEVKMGRLQIFNNWSPFLAKNSKTVWLGLEYFCNEGDDLWKKSDSDFIKFAAEELVKINIVAQNNILDGTVVRVKKAYPAYFGSYSQFDVIKKFVNQFENLFLIGRNGMHRYNNQDHSMLTAMAAVENILNNVKSKDNIWAVNAEQDYHESK